MTHNYCFKNKVLGTLFLGLLLCNIARGDSLLPGCRGSNFPTWTNCYVFIRNRSAQRLNFPGGWKNDKYHGQGTNISVDGRKYVGKWKDGLPNGQGTLTDSSGNKYVGEFKDGKRHGQGTYTISDGSIYIGRWEDSLPNGEGTYTFADGKIDKGIWKKGELIKRKK